MTLVLPTGPALVVACALAGALAAPLHPVGTPVYAALGGALALLGLRVWQWSGLRRAVLTKNHRGSSRLVGLGLWWGLGLLVGLMVLAVLRLVIEPHVPSIGVRITAAGSLPVWRRALIIYVAAVGEEAVFRLVLLSLMAGLAARLLGRSGQAPPRVLVWGANVVSALLFAGAHLPSWTGLAHLNLGLALAVITLNAVAGLILGHVFATHGIGAAIWTHAGADSAIQLLGPLTG